MMMEKNRARLCFNVAVRLIDIKTKYYRDRSGLEEGVEAPLFEWTPAEVAIIALVF